MPVFRSWRIETVVRLDKGIESQERSIEADGETMRVSRAAWRAALLTFGGRVSVDNLEWIKALWAAQVAMRIRTGRAGRRRIAGWEALLAEYERVALTKGHKEAALLLGIGVSTAKDWRRRVKKVEDGN